MGALGSERRVSRARRHEQRHGRLTLLLLALGHGLGLALASGGGLFLRHVEVLERNVSIDAYLTRITMRNVVGGK